MKHSPKVRKQKSPQVVAVNQLGLYEVVMPGRNRRRTWDGTPASTKVRPKNEIFEAGSKLQTLVWHQRILHGADSASTKRGKEIEKECAGIARLDAFESGKLFGRFEALCWVLGANSPETDGSVTSGS